MDMSFSFSDLFRYWDILTNYINPASIIFWGIVGGFIGTVVMIIFLVVFRKKVFINRRHWTLKILAYCYILFLPLLGGFCFTQWFALHNCQTQLVNNIPVYMGEANSLFNTYLKGEIEKIVEARHLEMTGRQAVDKALGLAGETVSEYVEATETDLGSRFSAYLVQTDFFKELIIDKISATAGDVLMTDKEVTDEMLDTEIQSILDEGVLNTVVEKQIRNIFGGLKVNVIIIFLIGLFIPLAEIILANYLEKRRLANIPPAMPMQQ